MRAGVDQADDPAERLALAVDDRQADQVDPVELVVGGLSGNCERAMKMRAPRSASAAVRSATPGDERDEAVAVLADAGDLERRRQARRRRPAGARPPAACRCQRDAASSACGSDGVGQDPEPALQAPGFADAADLEGIVGPGGADASRATSRSTRRAAGLRRRSSPARPGA